MSKDIEDIIIKFFEAKKNAKSYSREELLKLDFVKSGLVDSIEIVEIISFLENEFQLNLDFEAISDERFTIVEGLISIVKENLK